MNEELLEILAGNDVYKNAYYEWLNFCRENICKNNTDNEREIFENYISRNFLQGIKNDCNQRIEMIRGQRVIIRKAHIADTDFMNMVEMDEDNSRWISNWSLGMRICYFGDDDFLQTIIEKEDGTPIGYIIFWDMKYVKTTKTKIRLLRIAIIEKGKGYGKEALLLAQKLIFDVFKTKYLYANIDEHNLRARRIFKAVGFVEDKDEVSDGYVRLYMEKKKYV